MKSLFIFDIQLSIFETWISISLCDWIGTLPSNSHMHRLQCLQGYVIRYQRNVQYPWSQEGRTFSCFQDLWHPTMPLSAHRDMHHSCTSAEAFGMLSFACFQTIRIVNFYKSVDNWSLVSSSSSTGSSIISTSSPLLFNTNEYLIVIIALLGTS